MLLMRENILTKRYGNCMSIRKKLSRIYGRNGIFHPSRRCYLRTVCMVVLCIQMSQAKSMRFSCVKYNTLLSFILSRRFSLLALSAGIYSFLRAYFKFYFFIGNFHMNRNIVIIVYLLIYFLPIN